MKNIIAFLLSLMASFLCQGQTIMNGNFEINGNSSFDSWRLMPGDSAIYSNNPSPGGQTWSIHVHKSLDFQQSGLIYQPLNNVQAGDTIDFSGWIQPLNALQSQCGMGIGLLQGGMVDMASIDDTTMQFCVPGVWHQFIGTYVADSIESTDTIVVWMYAADGIVDCLFDNVVVNERVQEIQEAQQQFFFSSWNPNPEPGTLEEDRVVNQRIAYPNPAKDRALVRTEHRPISAVAYSASGQATQIPVDWNGSAVVWLESLLPGSYSIVMKTVGGIEVTKVAVEQQ